MRRKGTGRGRQRCFWCPRTGNTRDHLVSRPLAKLLLERFSIRIEREETVSCCTQCNQERSRLSLLLSVLMSVRQLQPRFRREAHLEKWRAAREKQLDLIDLYEQQCGDRLTGQVRDWCLLELAEIRAGSIGAN